MGVCGTISIGYQLAPIEGSTGLTCLPEASFSWDASKLKIGHSSILVQQTDDRPCGAMI